MSYKKFSKYASERDLIEMQDVQNIQTQQAQANNPANKALIKNNLLAAQKAPPPPGVNPQDYQNKIKSALSIANVAPVTNASAAVDIANAQNKVTQ